jgi:rare lipoprotein A
MKINLNLRIFLPAVFLMIILFCCLFAHADTASWYSRESCKHEGTSGIMANGKELKDDELTCASWDYCFGTRLLITNLANFRSVIVKVTDRGPAKRLYRKGRKIDLSKGAFSKIANLKQGIISCKVEIIK